MWKMRERSPCPGSGRDSRRAVVGWAGGPLCVPLRTGRHTEDASVGDGALGIGPTPH